MKNALAVIAAMFISSCSGLALKKAVPDDRSVLASASELLAAGDIDGSLKLIKRLEASDDKDVNGFIAMLYLARAQRAGSATTAIELDRDRFIYFMERSAFFGSEDAVNMLIAVHTYEGFGENKLDAEKGGCWERVISGKEKVSRCISSNLLKDLRSGKSRKLLRNKLQ